MMSARIEIIPTQYSHQLIIHSSEGILIGDSIEAPVDYLEEQIDNIRGEYLPVPFYELEEEPESFPCWKKCHYLMSGIRMIYFDNHGEECIHTDIVDNEDEEILNRIVWVLQHEMYNAIVDYEYE